MDRDVNGKVVAVTGSADGLGLAMLNSFLKHGAKLVICLDINETQGNKSIIDLKQQYGGRAVFYKCNVLTDLDTVYNTIIKNHEKVDVLVNNAGVTDEKDIRKTIETNTIALMEWSIKFYDHMRTDKGGSGGTIINVSSLFGYRIYPYIPYYHASKSAVIGFSKSLGHEVNFKSTGVRTVTLCPGLTRTKLTQAPNVREDDKLSEWLDSLGVLEWQEPEAIGEGTVEIFEKADSGTVWLVEGSRPAEKLNI